MLTSDFRWESSYKITPYQPGIHISMTSLKYLQNISSTNNEKLSSVDQCFLLASVEKFNSTADLGLDLTQVPRAEHQSGSAADRTPCLACPLQTLQQMLPHKYFDLTAIIMDKQEATYPIFFST